MDLGTVGDLGNVALVGTDPPNPEATSINIEAPAVNTYPEAPAVINIEVKRNI
jgi:hypothetical protein